MSYPHLGKFSQNIENISLAQNIKIQIVVLSTCRISNLFKTTF
jgi:hypothetical protein